MDNIPDSALQDIGLHEQITALGNDNNFPIDKLRAHLDNVRHLAISIFVFKAGKLLLQQRAATKYHSAGLWANTVCSHPRWQESPADCADRRLHEELGWHTPLTEFGRIDYSAEVGDLFENEYVHCFVGHLDDSAEIAPFNPREVLATEWLSLSEIDQRIHEQPEHFTAWFKIYMREHRDMIAERLTH